MTCYTKKNHVAFEIDDEDLPIVLSHSWYVSSRGYLSATDRTKSPKGETVLLHRLIMNTPKGMCTDHINGDKLNNHKTNLRICTIKQNIRNQKPKIGMTSKYKGVSWSKKMEMWKSGIKIDLRQIHLGYFKDEKDAALAYNESAINNYGEFARINAFEVN
jgi:hypothetical protein